MKRLITSLIIFIVLIGWSASAQVVDSVSTSKAPDMNKIQQVAKSKNKYNKLMARYLENDPTLTLEEYQQIYYGFIFQEEYNPYNKPSFKDDLVTSLYYKENPTRRQCDIIIECAEKSLEVDPFNLEQINYLIYAYRAQNKINLANFWQTRLNNVLRTILSTGNGKSPEDAWHVIDIGHEYALVEFINDNYIIDRSEFIAPHFDHIIIKQNSANSTNGFFFNIKYSIDNYNKRFSK